jgi:two-component system CheB/CheR fusion protein
MSFVDISDLKEAQAEFAHQNMVLRQVLDGAQAGHWEYDPETGVAVLSPSARVLLGHEPDEKIGKGNELRAVVHPGDAEILTDQLQQVAFSADVWEVDLRCQHSGGATLWFRCRARWEPTMERVVGALVDVTSLKEVESELIRSNDELRQFAYLTSHDLQEPLRTVSNFVEVLQNRYTDTIDEDGRQYLGIVSQATARMQALIRGILDYSRIGHDAVRSVVDIGAVILEATADLATAVEEAGAEIDVRPLPKVVGYEAELRMLFTNLLSNALKFRRPEVPLQITISAETEDQGWRVSVADNGIGIAAEHQDRIFEIFNRLHNRDSYEGAGIGLAHCRKIVELHGGVLAVDSEPGQGSAFSFVLNLSDGVDP